MHNLLKRRFKNKNGCGCQMCKPHKHRHADRRTLRDVRADISTMQQLTDFKNDFACIAQGRAPVS